MNLIALPHTNEFVRIFNIGEPVRVSEDFDELLHEVEPKLRPVALILRSSSSQEMAGARLGMSRSSVQLAAAVIRGEKREWKEPEPLPITPCKADKSDYEARITAFITERRMSGLTGAEISDELNEAGYMTERGYAFTSRTVHKWIQIRRLPSVPKSAPIYRRILELKAQGLSCREIARELNDAGIKTPRGREWVKNNVESTYKVAIGTKRPKKT